MPCNDDALVSEPSRYTEGRVADVRALPTIAQRKAMHDTGTNTDIRSLDLIR